jgi:hypothetical protein
MAKHDEVLDDKFIERYFNYGELYDNGNSIRLKPSPMYLEDLI